MRFHTVLFPGLPFSLLDRLILFLPTRRFFDLLSLAFGLVITIWWRRLFNLIKAIEIGRVEAFLGFEPPGQKYAIFSSSQFFIKANPSNLEFLHSTFVLRFFLLSTLTLDWSIRFALLLLYHSLSWECSTVLLLLHAKRIREFLFLSLSAFNYFTQ